VVAAARDGRFHVWAVRHVDEGIEILTGTEAGAPDDAGTFPAGSVNGRVASHLDELAHRYRAFENGDGSRREPKDGSGTSAPPALPAP